MKNLIAAALFTALILPTTIAGAKPPAKASTPAVRMTDAAILGATSGDYGPEIPCKPVHGIIPQREWKNASVVLCLDGSPTHVTDADLMMFFSKTNSQVAATNIGCLNRFLAGADPACKDTSILFALFSKGVKLHDGQSVSMTRDGLRFTVRNALSIGGIQYDIVPAGK